MRYLTRRKLLVVSSYIAGGLSVLLGAKTFKVKFSYSTRNGEFPDISENSGRNHKKGRKLDRAYMEKGLLLKISKKVSQNKLEYVYEFKDLQTYLAWESDVVKRGIFNRKKIGKNLNFTDHFII